jgi:hypothetical protein
MGMSLAKFYTRHGYGFFSVRIFSSRVWVWSSNTQRVFTHGYEFGQNFIPVMGMGFLAGVFFLRGYRFGQVIPNEFLPIVISRCDVN